MTAEGPGVGSANDAGPTRGARGEGAEAQYLISVAARLAGMHAQTLRTYDRLGLVSPQRTSGGGRRYSERDVDLLREVQRLSQEEGVNLAGIKRIIELTNQVEALQHRVRELHEDVLRRSAGRPAAALTHGERSSAVVVWSPRRNRGD